VYCTLPYVYIYYTLYFGSWLHSHLQPNWFLGYLTMLFRLQKFHDVECNSNMLTNGEYVGNDAAKAYFKASINLASREKGKGNL